MFKLPNFSLKQFIIMSIIGTMMMMESIDTNIITVAIPAIATNFNVTPLSIKLAITSYLVSLAIFIPVSGYIADKFGTKIVLLVAIVGFGVSSVLCGLSANLLQLVISRFVQGIFGALLVPVGRLLMLKAFPKADLVKAYMLISMPLLLGPLLAPYLGGLLVSYFNWRYIFLVNVPFSVIGFIATFKYADNYKNDVNPFNWIAFLCLAIFLATTAYWLDTAIDIASSKQQSIVLIISLSALILYLCVEFKTKYPIINYRLFKVPSYSICFWGSAFSRIALGARGFLLVLYLQLALSISPIRSGFMISWMALGYLFSRIVISKYLKILGFKQMLTICNIGTLITMLSFCFIKEYSYFSILLIISNGFFSAIILLLLNVLCFADIASTDYASATSLNSTTQQLFFAAGVTLAASVVYLSNLWLTQPYGVYTFYIAFVFTAFLGFASQIGFSRLDPNSGKNLQRT